LTKKGNDRLVVQGGIRPVKGITGNPRGHVGRQNPQHYTHIAKDHRGTSKNAVTTRLTVTWHRRAAGPSDISA